MKAPRQNPFMRIIICVLLMLLSQTAAAFAIVLFNGGTLFAEGMTMAEADAAMLEIMYDHQTEILLVSHGGVLACLWFMAHRRGRTCRTSPDCKNAPKRPFMCWRLPPVWPRHSGRPSPSISFPGPRRGWNPTRPNRVP